MRGVMVHKFCPHTPAVSISAYELLAGTLAGGRAMASGSMSACEQASAFRREIDELELRAIQFRCRRYRPSRTGSRCARSCDRPGRNWVRFRLDDGAVIEF